MTATQTKLFSPVTLPAPEGPGIEVRNRAFVAPMCQYSVAAEDGVPTDWHLVHLGAFATGGFGLVTAEATAVEARGRISPRDLGLWADDQIAAHARIVDDVQRHGAVPAIQLGHAGGKANTYPALPGFPSGSIPLDEGGWQTVAPSDQSLTGLAAPRALTTEQIAQIVRAFAEAAARADRAGYQVVQLHGAHGYLIHQFLSPLMNLRTDEYGGDLTGRSRFLREVVAAVREVWPAHKPLALRVSATDWVEGGLTVDEVSTVVRELVDDFGLAWIDVSSGGATGGSVIPVGPGYQVALAERVRRAVAGTPAIVSAVGLIDAADQAQTILASGQADAISIGRAALRNPHWAGVAAIRLGVPVDQNPVAGQYLRSVVH